MNKTITGFLVFFMFLFSMTSVFADNIVHVTPSSPLTTDNLFCSVVGGYVPDSYVWEKNGAQIADLTSSTVPASRTIKGQTWTCKALVNYGYGVIAQIGQDSVAIANSAPVLSPISAIAINEGTDLTYQTQASDADSDALVYSVSGVSGISISNTGLISLISAVAGNYDVAVSVTDSSGASATQTFVLTVNTVAPPVTLNVIAAANPVFGNAPLLVSFTATATGGTGSYNYAWDFETDGTFDAIGQNPSNNYLASGNYIATVVATDSTGNTGSATVSITVNAPGTFSVNALANPILGEVPLQVQFNSQLLNGQAPYSFQWDFDNDGVVDSTSSNPVHVYSAIGNYTATLTVTDGNGDVATDGVQVEVVSVLPFGIAISANPTTGQIPLTVSFDAMLTNPIGNVDFEWDLDGDGIIDSTSGNPIYTYLTPGIYSAAVTVVDSTGNSATDTIQIDVLSTLSASLTANPTQGIVPLAVTFTGNASGGVPFLPGNLGHPPYILSLDYGDGSSPVLLAPGVSITRTYATAGTYTATLTATDSASNIATTSAVIVVALPNSYAPTITTSSCPNGKVNQSYSCTITSNSQNGVTYTLTSKPSGMSINSNTGLISWKPSIDGSFSFTVRATDSSNNLHADKTFAVSVSKVDQTKADESDLTVSSIKFNEDSFSQGDSVTAVVSLKNDGKVDFKDLVVTMTIEDLGLSVNSGKFTLKADKTTSKTLSLELPSQLASGDYSVRFSFKNDDINVVKYKQITVKGTVISSTTKSSSQSSNLNVVSTPSLTSSAPMQSSPSLNWAGIWVMVLLLLVLLGVAAYLVKRLAEDKSNDQQATVVSLDDKFY